MTKKPSLATQKITTVVPFGMEVVQPVEGELNDDQWKSVVKNLLDFTAPALVVLFTQLALGVDWRASAGLALIALYGVARDYFKKRGNDTPYLRDK